jgi:hypothetical protein
VKKKEEDQVGSKGYIIQQVVSMCVGSVPEVSAGPRGMFPKRDAERR